MLSRLVYPKIKEKWGMMDVDLFAAGHNHQMKYYSCRPDPGVMAVDVFSQDWSHLHTYAFPPFLLVGRALQREQVERAVVIAPA